MSLKDVPVRARLWAPDRSLPRFFWETSSFFVRFNLTSFAQYLRAAETRGGVAQARRAAPSGNDKYGFRCRRVSFIHTSFCPAPLGNGKARKSRLTVPRVTFGCGTVRRHRSRRARRRPLLLSLEGFRGGGRMVVRPLYRPLYPAYSFDIWKFLLFLS